MAPEDRVAFLERSCGTNRALRADVESLLSHHAADTIMATDAASSKTISDMTDDAEVSPRETIGHGRVSAALFGSPVRRAIALAVLTVLFIALAVFTHYHIEAALRDVPVSAGYAGNAARSSLR